MRCSLQDLLATHFDDYARQHHLHPRELRAAWCIRHCGTASIGTNTLACPAGHFEHFEHLACKHRSCPRCASRPRQLWLDAQLARLLPCPHFHVVFTLPHVLLPLWSFNRTAMAALLFDCVRDCLLDLMADPKRLGVRPGLLMALHTWGRNLSQHPHIHCLVSAGGIDPSGLWKPGCVGFLLPLKPLQILFRGKFLARLKALLLAQRLRLPASDNLDHWLVCIRQLYLDHWNIEIQPPYANARGVALYLARYVKGGPVPLDRPLSIDSAGLVRMPYTDHRDKQSKTLCLPAHQFIARLLWHAPPKGMHTVRYGGLYSSAHPAQYHAAAQALQTPPSTPASTPASTSLQTHPRPPALTCPTCQQPLQIRFTHRPMHQKREISFTSQQAPRATVPHLGPTPSFKPRRDGEPPGPGCGYPVHFPQPGPAGSPSRPT